VIIIYCGQMITICSRTGQISYSKQTIH
jgi:hypothetical protein